MQKIGTSGRAKEVKTGTSGRGKELGTVAKHRLVFPCTLQYIT